MQDSEQPIIINTVTVIRLLAGVAVFLVLASVATQLVRFLGGDESLYGLVRMFFLDKENNIPTYYSSTMLLLAACLLAVIAISKKREKDTFAGHWIALAIIFLLLSMDEASSIHELFASPLRNHLGTSGYLYFAWVIPGIVFVVAIAITYWKFLMRLPGKTKRLFIAAAAVYVTGVIGTELIAGRYVELYGRDNLTYSFLAMFEEILEMTGIIVFVYALFDYLSTNARQVRFSIK